MPQVRPFVPDGWRRVSIPAADVPEDDLVEYSVQGE